MPTSDVTTAVADAAGHWGRLVALLIGQFKRIDLAEDAVQEAYAAATRTWSTTGVPANPAGWLLTAARRRALDTLRAEAIAARKLPLLAVDERSAPSAQPGRGDEIVDDRLRLIFMCCHPAVPAASSAALTLRLVAGLTVSEIARLFLVSESTMAARITRAKRKIVAAGIPFAVPPAERLAERLEVVLAVIYLVFTEGYAATEGAALVRVDLCDEAIRLGQTLDGLVEGQPAVKAVRALMVLQHSRRSSRVGDDGRPILLADQDRRQWHHDEIAEGLRLLDGAIRQRSDDPAAERVAVRYRLEALIAAAHATRRLRPPPTGRRSRRCTPNWTCSPAHRSCGSTGPSPSPRSRDPPRRWRCSTDSPTSSPTARISPPCAASCSTVSAAGLTPRRRSPQRSPWRRTMPSAPTSVAG